MKAIFRTHILSMFLVAIIFAVLFNWASSDRPDYDIEPPELIKPFIEDAPMNIDDPADRALFEETLRYFNKEDQTRNDSIVEAIENYRIELLRSKKLKAEAESLRLDKAKFENILLMYLQFIFVFVIVLILTYYGTQTLALFRFIKTKQRRESYLLEVFNHLRKIKDDYQNKGLYLKVIKAFLKAVIKGFAYILLFSPAYVIAYSIKTKFDTDTVFFMVLLGFFSNGLLINYANKFYNLLLAESKKGFVQTAIVKNLSSSFEFNKQNGIKLFSIFKFRKQFDGHILNHIFMNAKYQYIQTIKEQASFLITGLVIIEMALNLQGHLNYEMLKNILYQQYDIVLLIVFLIFILVKFTEISVDLIYNKISSRYENLSD